MAAAGAALTMSHTRATSNLGATGAISRTSATGAASGAFTANTPGATNTNADGAEDRNKNK